MTLIAHTGKRRGPDGKPIVTFGFRFWHHGRLYKKMLGRTRQLAIEAEKRERARLEGVAFEAAYGPLQPRLTPWDEALGRYRVAKAAKRSLYYDDLHFAWWGRFFASHTIHYLQSITPESLDQAKVELRSEGRSEATIQRYLSTLRGLLNVALKRWGVLAPTRSAGAVCARCSARASPPRSP